MSIHEDIKDGKTDVIIEGTANLINSIRELFTRYFVSKTMTLEDAMTLLNSQTIVKGADAIAISLFMNIKQGGDQAVLAKLRDAIDRFDKFFDTIMDEGYDFEKFDFVVIADTLILAEFKELTDYHKRRIANIDDYAKWLIDSMPIVDLANHELHHTDEIEDVEMEYKFKFDRLFDDLEDLQRRIEVFMKFKELHDIAENVSLTEYFEFVRVLRNRIERYSDSRSPVEYVKAKYKEAIENGEMIIGDEYKLEDWELDGIADIFADKILLGKNPDIETAEPQESHSASTSNSALFNKEFFSMTHVQHLHKTCNGRQFEEISPGDMYLILNLQHCPRSMKVREREKTRVCHLIYLLGEMLPDTHRLNWRKGLLDHLKIPYSIYNKKYKESEKGLSSRQDENFVERLEQLKDIYRELERVV